MVLALYSWAFFADVESISKSLLVGSGAAILAAIVLFVSTVLYLWVPKRIFVASLSVFGMLVVLTAALIVETGQTDSPFIALWMIVSIFAGIFGIYALGPLMAILAAYVGMSLMQNTLDIQQVTTVALGGIVPLIVSYLLWHTQRKSSRDPDDRAYKELASELSQVAGKAEVVINAIGDGVIALSGDGVIELINPAAQRFIGWGKQDALGLDYKSVLKLSGKDDEELTDATDPVMRAITDNTPINSRDFSLTTNSGKKQLVSLVISPVGQIGSGVIIVFRDITKELAEERQQAEFISTASHEMRTPVASIEGYLGLALNPATAQIDEKARDFIQKAHESAQHLGRLFQDLLDVTRADDGRMSNNPKVVDVVDFTQSVVQGLTPKANEKGLRVTYKPRPESETGSSDRVVAPILYANVDNDHLREVLSNLVENAIKYTPQGDIIVDVNAEDDKVVVSIQDSGIGIPREDQGHLFQKFYRVDNSDTREIGGTGLGLYLCRRIVETMNGRIWVESEYKQGSTFYIALPRLANDEATRIIEKAAAEAETEPTPIILETRPTLSAPEPQASPSIAPPVSPPTPLSQAPQTPVIPPVMPAIPSQPTLQQPPIAPPPTSSQQPYPNTPISAIEQRAEQYASQQRSANLTIPSRSRFK